MTHVVSTHISLARASPMATPDFEGGEEPHSISAWKENGQRWVPQLAHL